jgi:hypothetical protein
MNIVGRAGVGPPPHTFLVQVDAPYEYFPRISLPVYHPNRQ